MIRYFAPIGALLLAGILLARGQGADEKYVWIYTLIQEADSFNEKGAKTEAASKYAEAQQLLQDLQKRYPDWNTKVINYRIGYVASKLEPLAAQVALPANPNARLTASASVDLAAKSGTGATNVAPISTEEFKAMQEEISRLNNQNALLQAKLKEAQTVQPAGSDPRELAKAEEQIRVLQKDKDLLQVRLAQEEAKAAKVLDPAILEQERTLLSDIKQRLASQLELAAALQEENATLKQRVADLQTSAPLPSGKVARQLEVARTMIAALQATNIALRSGQIILETRLADARKNSTTSTLVEKLERERDDLRRQLEVALKARPAEAGDANGELDRQLKIARARLEAFEARAVPYTPEELALFKQPDKTIAVAAAKPKQEPPSGAGALVAEAQRAVDSGRLEEAEKKYQDVLRQDEKNTYTLARLAAVQMDQGRFPQAEETVNKALAVDPGEPMCLYLKGYLRFRQEKYDEAFDALSLSAKALPDEPRTQYLLGKVLLQKGHPAQAETALRKAVQLIPGYREAHYSLALIYSKQKPPLKELAQWHYRKATLLGYPADPVLEKQLQEAPTVSSTAN